MNKSLIRKEVLFSLQFPKGQFKRSQIVILNKEDLSIGQYWPLMD